MMRPQNERMKLHNTKTNLNMPKIGPKYPIYKKSLSKKKKSKKKIYISRDIYS